MSPLHSAPTTQRRNLRRCGLVVACLVLTSCRAATEISDGAFDHGTVDPANFAFSATVRLVGGTTLDVRITMVNVSGKRAYFEHGVCPFETQVHRTTSSSDKPIWILPSGSSWPAPGDNVCPAILAFGYLNPGQVRSPSEFHHAIPISSILGDSIPAGLHAITVKLHDMGEPTLDGGVVELRLPAP